MSFLLSVYFLLSFFKVSSHDLANSSRLWRTTCPWFLIPAQRVTSLTLEMTANWGSLPGERCWTTPKRSFLLPACEIGRHNQKKIVDLPDGRCQKKQWGGLGCCLRLLLFFSSFYSYSFFFLLQETIYLNVRGKTKSTPVPEVALRLSEWCSGTSDRLTGSNRWSTGRLVMLTLIFGSIDEPLRRQRLSVWVHKVSGVSVICHETINGFRFNPATLCGRGWGFLYFRKWWEW